MAELLDGILYVAFMICWLFVGMGVAAVIAWPFSKLTDKWYDETEKGGWDE